MKQRQPGTRYAGPRHTLGGWILLETMTVLLVVTIILGALANVWTAQVRTARIVTERLERERVRTAAFLYAYGELTATERGAGVERSGAVATPVPATREKTVIAIADEIRERYPELEVTVNGTILTIDGDRLEWTGGNR